MRRVSFEIPENALDALCDGVLADLPHGLRDIPAADGRRRIEAVGLAEDLPPREEFELAAGVPLAGWAEEPVAADAAQRRAAIDGGVVIDGRLVIRRPDDPPPNDASLIDVVIDRVSGGFGTGTHPTTRMCLELLLDLPATGGLADLGCGLGVLGIVAARLGYEPVIGIDRNTSAIDVARENAERNDVAVQFVEGDVTPGSIPDVRTLILNGPPAMHAAVAAGLPPSTHLVIASGPLLAELDDVLADYAEAGMVGRVRREDDVWGACVLIRRERDNG